jgi:restriction system protein
MPRYWVIAPFENKKEVFDQVWQFDLANNMISIGWSELGDISKMNREDISRAVTGAYPASPPATKSLIANMLWKFFHEVMPGDFIIARRGLKVLAAVGRVIVPAQYIPSINPAITHGNVLSVEWLTEPRDRIFPVNVFQMITVAEITKAKFDSLTDGSSAHFTAPEPSDKGDQIELGPEQYVFALEKYLEEFIVSNFDAVFNKKMRIHEDALGKGQQYPTDVGPIDILAVDADSGSFVVIELKKARTSDQVVGQILRYMGWVKKNLCKEDQAVKGIVICRENDEKLSYAMVMTSGIEIKYYGVKFWLNEAPVASVGA